MCNKRSVKNTPFFTVIFEWCMIQWESRTLRWLEEYRCIVPFQKYIKLSKEVSDSIVSQRTIIENKIKELGEDFELADFYIDDGYTGLNTDRPAFQKMLSDIEISNKTKPFKINTV